MKSESLLPALAYTNEPQNVDDKLRPMHTVVVGNSGSGKSTATRSSFVEPLLDVQRRRGVIIDPTGVWWGLRFRTDGSRGYDVPIIGGQYGDVPLKPSDGDRLAQWIAENDGFCIVDVSEMMIGERHEFATAFFQSIYKHNKRPLHFIVDEADEFAPQNPLPETRRMLHHFDRIVRRGRVRGFRVSMLTQRPAVLHKNVLSQANILIAMRLLGSQDRAAVLDWVKGQGDIEAGKQVLNTLAKLQTGEGWLWAPSLSILNRGRFPMFKTFDSMRTPGDDEPPVEPPGPFPAVSMSQSIARFLGDDDPVLPAEISSPADLKGNGKWTKSAVYEACEKARKEGREVGFKDGYAASNSTLQGLITGVINKSGEFLDNIRALGDEMAVRLSNLPLPLEDHPVVTVHASRNASGATLKALEEVATLASGSMKQKEIKANRFSHSTDLPPAARALLDSLDSLGHVAASGRALTWFDLCVACGMSHGNGYFYGGRKYLVDNDLVKETVGAGIFYTSQGKKKFNKVPQVYFDDIFAIWNGKLKRPGGEMLRFIAEQLRQETTQADIAKGTGIKPGNGYWYGGLKTLQTHHLAIVDGSCVKLTPFLQHMCASKPYRL